MITPALGSYIKHVQMWSYLMGVGHEMAWGCAGMARAHVSGVNGPLLQAHRHHRKGQARPATNQLRLPGSISRLPVPDNSGTVPVHSGGNAAHKAGHALLIRLEEACRSTHQVPSGWQIVVGQPSLA